MTFPLFEMNGDINIYCFVALTSDALVLPSPFFFFNFPLTLEERGQFVPSIDPDLGDREIIRILKISAARWQNTYTDVHAKTPLPALRSPPFLAEIQSSEI